MTRFYAGQLDYIPQLNAMDATIAGTSAVTPQPLGTATAGASSSVSRGDHVHASTGTTQTIDDNSLQYATTGFVQQAISTTLSKSIVGGVTLTAAEAATPIINMTGVLTANAVVIVPSASHTWLFLNNTTGAFTTTIKTSAGTGVSIVQGSNKALYSDAVNVLATNTDISSLSLSGLSLTGTTGGAINGTLSTTSDLTVGGNLTVNGTTTTVNSTTVTIKDPVITLGGAIAPVATDSKDRGIEYRYFNGSAKVGFFGYKDSTGKFTFIPDATNTSEVFTGATGTLTANIDGTAANVTGIVAVVNGGTGASTATTALSNLGAAPLASPALTGTPTAPTASTTDNTTTLATTGFVQSLRDITGGFVSMTLYKINFKNALNTFTSFFTNSNTAPRLYTFQDRDGTIADNTDLALKANLASPTFTGTVSGVTATMVGLGNVNNTSDASKPTSTATTSALALKADLASPTFTGTVGGITSTMVGLGNVTNTSDASKPVSTAQATAIALKAAAASPTFTGTVSGITSAMVALGNVDNTSDVNKPVSTAQAAATAAQAASLAASGGAGMVGTTAVGTGAIPRTVQNKLSERMSLLDFIPSSEHAAIFAGSSTYNCLPAMQSALAYQRPSTSQSETYGAAGPDIYAPAGTYVFSGNVELKRRVRIYGESSAQGNSSEGTVFQFPANSHGVVCHALNTIGSGVAAPTTTQGAGSTLENIHLKGTRTGSTSGYGVWMRARMTLRQVNISNFEGGGFYADVTAGSGGATEGNANNWAAEFVRIRGCGSHGWFVRGADANAGSATGIDCYDNDLSGIYDASFLGNTYLACHVDGSGKLSQVSYLGNRYYCLSDTLGGSNAPGTNAAVWELVGAGGVQLVYPAWVSLNTYKIGACYRSDNPNAANVFLGCYAESGQPAAWVMSPAIMLGGQIRGAGLVKSATGVYLGGGLLGSLRAIGSLMVSATDTAGNVVETVLGGSPDNGDIVKSTHASAAVNSWRLRYSGADLAFDYANSATVFRVTGPTTTQQFGTGVAVPYALHSDAFYLGDRGNARRQTTGAAAPTTGAHAQGEVVWSLNAAASGKVGWVCVATGTPGTWKPFGAIDA